MSKILFVFLFSFAAVSASSLAAESGFAGQWSGKAIATYGTDPAIGCETFNFDLTQEKYFIINGEADCDGNRHYWGYQIGIRGGDLVLGDGDPTDPVIGKISANEVIFRVTGSDGTDWNVSMKLANDRLFYHEDITTSDNEKSTLDGELERF